MSQDPQSEKFKRKLSDIEAGRQIKTDFSKEENRARLQKTKKKLSDYPTEFIVIAILLLLTLLYLVSRLL